jgi:hypothetical protein
MWNIFKVFVQKTSRTTRGNLHACEGKLILEKLDVKMRTGWKILVKTVKEEELNNYGFLKRFSQLASQLFRIFID